MLRVFSDVREGEGVTVLLMFSNLMALLVAYYVLRTVRDAVILARGGAVVQSYASAGMALILMGFIPLYSWFATRVNRVKLVLGVLLFFIINLELFALVFSIPGRVVPVAYFIWVGIFNNAAVAQFWSFANDLYRKQAGERLFPVIAIGAAVGSPLGAKLPQVLFQAGLEPVFMLQIAAALLAVHLALYVLVQRRESRRPDQAEIAQAPVPPGGGFSLVLASPYLRAVALLIVLLNVVNTNGNSSSTRRWCARPMPRPPAIPRSAARRSSERFSAGSPSTRTSWLS